MKKNKSLSSDEALVKVFEVTLDHISKTDKLDLEAISHEIKFYEQMIKLKHDEEPLKFFKSSHKKWEAELDDLESQLYRTYEEIGKEVQEQCEFYKKLKSQ